MQVWIARYHLIIRTLLFVFYFINGLIYIPQQSVNSDERDHFSYAIRFVKGHPEKIRPFDDASTMPVSTLNTIPRIAEQLLHPGLQKNDWGAGDITHGRYLTLIVSLLIGLYVYIWSMNLFGKIPALFSLLLFVFCPNILAHAGLLTTDAYSALFTIIPLYHFWRYSKDSSRKQFVLFSIGVSLAQLCKQSLTFLYPIFFLLFIVLAFRSGSIQNLISKKAIRRLLLFIVLQIIVINAGFYFKGTGTRMNEYKFRSSFFISLQSDLGSIGNLPLPLPTPYLEGLDCTKAIDEIGGGHPESSHKIYLLGQSREGRGFWNYYFVNLFFKTPVPLLLSFFASFYFFFRKGKKSEYWDGIVLLIPVIFFLFYFNLFYQSQVGIRHILMIFPLLQVFAGLFFNELIKIKRGIIVCIVLALYSAATFYYYFPNLMPYTNEFILNKKMTYKIMADSNQDYGLAVNRLQKWLDNKTGRYATTMPSSGTFIISVDDLLGLTKDNNYKWLKDNFKPSAQLCFTYLIFTISENELFEKGLILK